MNHHTMRSVGDDDVDDDEYVPSTDSDGDDEKEEEAEERESARVDYGTFAEHIAWIRREGGIGELMAMIMQTNPRGLSEDLGPEASQELRNWLVPVIPEDFTENLFAGRLADIPNPDELTEGSIFESKELLKLAVGLWHLEHRAEFIIPRSDLDMITFKCKYRNRCPFQLRATQQGSFWFHAHTCIGDMVNTGVQKFHARVIAAHIAKKMREDGEIVKPRTIMADLHREYGVKISYSVTIRARNGAVEMIYGGHKESYSLLPAYLHMLRTCNPGSLTDLEIDASGRFKHLFVALGSCRLAYTMCLRPVIVVYGTHLKGRNKGILIVAVTKDGNEQVFPLTFGVGPIENDESWMWFLSRVKSAYGENSEMLIVSDAHVSIPNAVKAVYPEVAHGLCYYHLLNKLTRFGKAAVALYQKAAYAYREREFDAAMASLKALKEEGGAYSKLMQVGPEKWSRCKCPVPRYSFLTSNIAESFNSRLLWARRLPICSMVEAIRHIIEKWFDERHEAAKSFSADVTPEAPSKLTVELERSRRYEVVPISRTAFKVKSSNKTFKVNLETHSCTCVEWDTNGLPCSHAVAAIRHTGDDISKHVGDYYQAAKLREAYSYRVNSAPPLASWTIPANLQGIAIDPPKIGKQAGRPKSTRHRAPTERTTSRRRNESENTASGSSSRGPLTCSLCGSESHTIDICPYLIPRD
ncbi:uncharacterized protein LOC130998443 [Salvia miltiorrhiza]|uniref:uncharacterized protein LOC130998443 n=1 Tax=Salvia miltiorrhiza TaxID=226208 RepID=UPI0025AB7164|nr:uncharacterized protein LOC130998443 [Salvia miltiorrhiza]